MRKLGLTAALLLAAISVRADQLLSTAEGTTWEYNSTETITGTAPVQSTVTVRAGKQLLDDKEVVKFETLSKNVISKTELMTVDENGIVCLARNGRDAKIIKLNPSETIIAVPLKVGARWSQESEVAGIKMHQRWIVVTEENVSVPAGQFRAFHLQCEDSSLMSIKLDRWFVPGTGFVKEATVVKGPGVLQRVTLELRKISEALPKPLPAPVAMASVTPGHPPAAAPNSVPVTPPGTLPEAVAQPENQPAALARKLTVEVSSDPVGGLKTEFKSDVANIYVRWHGHDLPEGARIRVAWVAEDVGDLVEPNFVIDETETIAAAPDASARFTLGRPPDGWAEGKYRVEFYIDDALMETVKVTIGK